MNALLEKLFTLIRNELVILERLVERLFQKQIDATGSLKNELGDLTRELKNQKPPVVNLPPMKVEVKSADLQLPKLEFPPYPKEMEVKGLAGLVKSILDAIRGITVKPEVTVNVPPIKFPKQEKQVINIDPKVEVKYPKEMTVEGFRDFAKKILAIVSQDKPNLTQLYDLQNPQPVVLVDPKYKEPYRASGGSTAQASGIPDTDPLEKYKSLIVMKQVLLSTTDSPTEMVTGTSLSKMVQRIVTLLDQKPTQLIGPIALLLLTNIFMKFSNGL